jgi:MFS family permease
VSLTITARLIRRVGHRAVIVAGVLISAAGALLLSVVVGATPDYATYLPPVLAVGAGIGLTAPTLPAAMTTALPPGRRATRSAIFAMSRQLGTVLGVAALVALLPAGAHHLGDYRDTWTVVVGAELAAAAAALAIGRTVHQHRGQSN